jgi:hypothetical protein
VRSPYQRLRRVVPVFAQHALAGCDDAKGLRFTPHQLTVRRLYQVRVESGQVDVRGFARSKEEARDGERLEGPGQ